MSALEEEDDDQKFWKTRSQLQEVIPRLFITNYFGASKQENLTAHGITHVVVCDPRLNMCHPDIAQYLRVPIDDNPGQDILQSLPEVLLWIDEALQQEQSSVLVHCAAGVSRSGAIVTAFVMYKQKVSMEVALNTVQAARTLVNPNVGFREQLTKFADEFQFDLDLLKSKPKSKK
eukprot:TRINITY_DN5560_c0_g1_i1.p1 TRINITY_DN5560_c0_g1~~TRINITY_DN5560_c0_g1_i1.p1  ORF type:complete len:185 (-),score=39.16 TRINITY_DN5560_c0_g1_i1:266-790(-)